MKTKGFTLIELMIAIAIIGIIASIALPLIQEKRGHSEKSSPPPVENMVVPTPVQATPPASAASTP